MIAAAIRTLKDCSFYFNVQFFWKRMIIRIFAGNKFFNQLHDYLLVIQKVAYIA
ncbi:hypothetical protein JCM10512_2971 [Bacteroides reticulotermitis JCM 10512]|uniref:Uncharacterized protein n=1 Tax=Bacteroides reticulotermitis JCM 10512 TaxID=1445607 RepID=W4UVI6_9BACE|nr:hypothetical protein JCM10512_2971 [Bacteroides reticulotermitis JCM 10512]